MFAIIIHFLDLECLKEKHEKVYEEIFLYFEEKQ
jgi:hypothetical protein